MGNCASKLNNYRQNREKPNEYLLFAICGGRWRHEGWARMKEETSVKPWLYNVYPDPQYCWKLDPDPDPH
jgi:hypothetical protein